MKKRMYVAPDTVPEPPRVHTFHFADFLFLGSPNIESGALKNGP